MEAPEGCPSEIYEIMKQSWDLDPDNRPTFSLILKKLEHLKTLAIQTKREDKRKQKQQK